MKSSRLLNIFWLLFENFGLVILSGFSFFAFAFFLSPSQLGMGTVVIVISEMISSFYCAVFESPLVKRHCKSKVELSSTFWFGGIVSSATCVFSSFIYYFFDNESEIWCMLLFATLSVAASVQARPFIAITRHRREFKKLAIRTLWGKIIGALIAIISAISGAGEWSLIIQLAVMNLVALIILLVPNASIIMVKPTISSFISISKEGITIGLRQLLSGFFGRGLVIIMSLVASPSLIGYYSFGRRLMELPKQAISAALRSYSLPVFASRTQNKAEVSNLFTNLTLFVFIILFPLFVFIGILGQEFITVVFGDKWQGATLFFGIFSIIAGIQLIEVFAEPIQAAFGKSKIGLYGDIWKTIFTLTLAYFLGKEFGLVGIAFSIATDTLLTIWIRFYAVNKIIKIDVFSLFFDVIKSSVVTTFAAFITLKVVQENDYSEIGTTVVCFLSLTLLFLSYFLLYGNWVKKVKDTILGK